MSKKGTRKEKLLAPLNLTGIHNVLRKRILGKANAKPIEKVLTALFADAFVFTRPTRREFQLLVKPALLDQGVVVAPGRKGVFLCDSDEDFQAAVNWCEDRIEAQTTNLSKIVNVWNGQN